MVKSIDICFSSFRLSAAISVWLTASHPNSYVKQVRAGVVLRWGATREGPVLRFFCISFSSCFSFLFLKPSRFSLCSPSLVTYHSRSATCTCMCMHMHMLHAHVVHDM